MDVAFPSFKTSFDAVEARRKSEATEGLKLKRPIEGRFKSNNG